jgi:VWFA-related protein
VTPPGHAPAHAIALSLVLFGASLALAQGTSPSDGAPSAAPAARPAQPDPPTVRIDAVVTDRNRRSPVTDLRPGDFEVLDNGVAQKTVSVELRTRTRSAVGPSPPIDSAEDEARAARQPGTQVFALFLDEFHVEAGANSARVRSAVARFIDEQLHPSDLALVVKPLDSLTTLRFTRDRAALRSAVDSFEGRKGDLEPRTRFEEQYIGRAPAAIALARAQIATAALRELAMKLGDLQADRAVIVMVSEGFPRAGPGRLSRNSDVQGIVRAASRFNLALYTFSPAVREDVGAVDPTKNDTPAGMLQWLAVQTGGQAVLDGSAIDAGLRRMSSDLSVYYVLTYRPERADGRFHALEVKTTRPHAQVRTVPGYWSPLNTEWRTAVTSASLIARRALRRSPLVNVWTGLSRQADGRARLSVTWEAKGSPMRPAQLISLTAQTSAGVKLFEGSLGAVGSTDGPARRVVFDVPAGRVELDMIIRALDGGTLDTDARDVEVPSVEKARGPVLLTPEIIRARTAREFGALRADPDATPTPDRAFSRSDRLLIRVPTWDNTGTAVDVTVFVLNRWGQSMRPIDAAGSVGNPQFELPLAWLAAGDYAISVVARNANGQASERINITVNR